MCWNCEGMKPGASCVCVCVCVRVRGLIWSGCITQSHHFWIFCIIRWDKGLRMEPGFIIRPRSLAECSRFIRQSFWGRSCCWALIASKCCHDIVCSFHLEVSDMSSDWTTAVTLRKFKLESQNDSACYTRRGSLCVRLDSMISWSFGADSICIVIIKYHDSILRFIVIFLNGYDVVGWMDGW